MNNRLVHLIIIIIQFLVINQIDAQDGITLNAKVFLSGCYSNSEMRTDLLNHDLIPKSQPFNNSVWNYNGLESVSNIPPNIVDWILIELRSNLTTKINQKAAFLRKDGQIVDMEGVSNLVFSSIQPGEYYIIVYHRNHLAVMSSSKTLLNDSSPLYDFTDSQLKAYGTNSLKDLGDGNFGMISGDGDQNGVINNLDYGTVANNIFTSGYISGDLDMSEFVNVIDYSQVYNNLLNKSSIPDELSNIIEDPDFFVYTFEELKTAVANADSGDIIQIQNDIELVRTAGAYNEIPILVTKSITIQGASYADRPRITADRSEYGIAFFGGGGASGDTIYYKNLHIDGEDADWGGQYGLTVGGWDLRGGYENATMVIDSCEVTGFHEGGIVFINGGSGIVKNSWIHSNQDDGRGYGVSVAYGGQATIYNCVLDSNRHHVAGSGYPTDSYEIYNCDIYYSSSHALDMHSGANAQDRGSNYPYAGDTVSIHDNRFYGEATPPSGEGGAYRGIRIRGVPIRGAEIYNNIFSQQWIWRSISGSTVEAIETTQEADTTLFGNIRVWENSYNFEGYNSDYAYWTFQVEDDSGWVALCGFGLAWTRTGAQDDEIISDYLVDSLAFGDFNGDGITDVVTGFIPAGVYPEGANPFDIDPTKMKISWSALTYWQELNNTRYPMADIAVADVDGDGKSDLIYNESIYSSAGSGAWIELPNAFNTYVIYTKRDFNGDGVDDNYRVSNE